MVYEVYTFKKVTDDAPHAVHGPFLSEEEATNYARRLLTDYVWGIVSRPAW